MTINHPEPLNTFIERQIHTDTILRYVVHDLYNILYHEGSQSMKGAHDMLVQRLYNGAMQLPDLRFDEQLALVELGLRYRYSSHEWTPDQVVVNCASDTWLHDWIAMQARTFVCLIAKWTCDILCNELSEIARGCSFVDPWILGGKAQEEVVARVETFTEHRNSAIGTEFILPSERKFYGRILVQGVEHYGIYLFDHDIKLEGVAL